MLHLLPLPPSLFLMAPPASDVKVLTPSTVSAPPPSGKSTPSTVPVSTPPPSEKPTPSTVPASMPLSSVKTPTPSTVPHVPDEVDPLDSEGPPSRKPTRPDRVPS